MADRSNETAALFAEWAAEQLVEMPPADGELPDGWRMGSYEDLEEAGWTHEEIGEIGPVVVGPDGHLREIEISFTFSVLRRATVEELAVANAALARLAAAEGGKDHA